MFHRVCVCVCCVRVCECANEQASERLSVCDRNALAKIHRDEWANRALRQVTNGLSIISALVHISDQLGQPAPLVVRICCGSDEQQARQNWLLHLYSCLFRPHSKQTQILLPNFTASEPLLEASHMATIDYIPLCNDPMHTPSCL